MDGDLDPFDFALASELGMSWAAVQAMPNNEVVAWQAYFVWRDANAKLEAKAP